MKISHFVLTAFLLRFTSVSSLGLRAGGKTEIAGERILANGVVSPDLLSIAPPHLPYSVILCHLT